MRMLPISQKRLWYNRGVILLTLLTGILLYLSKIENGFYTEKELYKMSYEQLKDISIQRKKEVEDCHVKYMSIKEKEEAQKLTILQNKEKETREYTKAINSQLKDLLKKEYYQKGGNLFTSSKKDIIKDIIYYQNQIKECNHDIKNIKAMVQQEMLSLLSRIRGVEALSGSKILQIMKRS